MAVTISGMTGRGSIRHNNRTFSAANIDRRRPAQNVTFCREVLDEYMRAFQERNPHLRVFNAVLHMDEATPHIHIDFVPVATEQTRGLQTRVSMKQALGLV